jgi:hypothetical protein
VTEIDDTHDPRRRCWIKSANGHRNFPIQNLPPATAINRLRFVETAPIVAPQIRREPGKIAWASFLSNDVTMIELDSGFCPVEEWDIHDSQVVEMREEFITIPARSSGPPMTLGNTHMSWAAHSVSV